MNDDLKKNLAKLHRNYSTWVVVAVSAVAGYWLQLPVAEQQALIAAYPWLKHAAPVAGLVAFLCARVLPQGGNDKPPEQ